MDGSFGVFYGVELLSGTFGSDVGADEYRRELLQEHLPEHLRTAEYDEWELEVRPVPEDYDLWHRLLVGLKESRRCDLQGERRVCAAA